MLDSPIKMARVKSTIIFDEATKSGGLPVHYLSLPEDQDPPVTRLATCRDDTITTSGAVTAIVVTSKHCLSKQKQTNKPHAWVFVFEKTKKREQCLASLSTLIPDNTIDHIHIQIK